MKINPKYTFDEAFFLFEKSIFSQSENEVVSLVRDLFNLDPNRCLLCLRASVYTHLLIGDRTATLYALRCIDDTEMFWKNGINTWKQTLENVVFVIFRASHYCLDNECRDEMIIAGARYKRKKRND